MEDHPFTPFQGTDAEGSQSLLSVFVQEKVASEEDGRGICGTVPASLSQSESEHVPLPL